MNIRPPHTYAWNSFDVIVVGGGHAGVEAAYAAARMGSKTLLVTLNPDKVGYMPCNPAVGGIGKGHIVFEISALGGLMPQLCSQAYLQARMLNTRKGPAVQGLRLQIDKNAYNNLCKQTLEATENLTLIGGMVEELLFDAQGKIHGLTTREGATYYAPSIVLTTGTFLNGLVHTGAKNYASGRQGEEAVVGLAAAIKNLGLQMGRLKTGTPPRLIRSSIDFSCMERQGSDELNYLFGFHKDPVVHKMDCYVTHTNERTHDVIRKNAHQSPIYMGHIKGTPPRYCPSIEDKISRFADKTSHHVFVEPESASSAEVYPNGLSTAMPLEVQREFIQTIRGFENAIIARPGYAIEYDYVFPNQLHHTLELKSVPGLFLAGQINGTTGYEEAAGQGLIAGINAHLKAHEKSPYIMSRNSGYIGIMIDDLVTLGVDEPYRMFTSRAERRLVLRQDNVFTRLVEDAQKLQLIDQQLSDAIHAETTVVAAVVAKLQAVPHVHRALMQSLSEGNVDAVYAEIHKTFTDMYSHACFHTSPRLRRTGRLDGVHTERSRSAQHERMRDKLTDRAAASIYAELLYGPYLKREQREIEKMEQYQQLEIPAALDFATIPGLSKELQQKLSKHKPATIAQAMLIQGMTPAAISLLIFKCRELLERKVSD